MLRGILDKKDKRGDSILIGYILLIVLAVTIVATIYPTLKKLIPKDEIKCPEGVSVTVESYSCESPPESGNDFSITIKNSGRFSIAGVYIRGAGAEEEIATYNLFESKTGLGGQPLEYWPENAIDNSVASESLITDFPNPLDYTGLPSKTTLKMIEILPFRIENQDGKNRFILCTDARIKQDITDADCVYTEPSTP